MGVDVDMVTRRGKSPADSGAERAAAAGD